MTKGKYIRTLEMRKNIGRYIRTPKIRRRMSDAKFKLYKAHPEIREKISKSRKLMLMFHPEKRLVGKRNGMYGKGYLVTGKDNPFYGRKHTKMTKGIISMRGLGRRHTEDAKHEISVAQLKSWKGNAKRKSDLSKRMSGDNNPTKRPEVRLKISMAQMGKRYPDYINKKKGLKGKLNPFYGKRHGERTKFLIRENHADFSGENHPMWGKHLSAKTRKKMSVAKMGQKLSAETLRKILIANNRKPNKFELAVQQHLDPEEWKYCGDGSVVLNGRCPDFINVNGAKQVILANGNYWHTIAKGTKTKKQAEQIERKPYNELGYDVLFIWEDEFKKEAVLA